MKKLYLVRHAKSSWKNNLKDFDRPLKKRGFKDALLVSKYLNNSFLMPDQILSSGALRAKTTAKIFIENLELNSIKFELKNELYDFSGNQLLNVIRYSDDSIDKLMIFGHNNAITNFVNTYGDKRIINVTTSGFIEIDYNINSWNDINIGTTKRVVFPKDLK